MDSLQSRLSEIRVRVAKAAAEAGRDADSVTLIAVTKTVPAEVIEEALGLGLRVFGENRVQEAAEKYPGLKARWPGIALHHIGPLQSNKLNSALQLFDCLHTLDRLSLAEALARKAEAGAILPPIYVQVNIGEEPQKAGIPPAEADDFIALCRDRLALPIRGLMCIPPVEAPPAPYFALLAAIAARHGLAALSMGMSADFETAIRQGATHIRVGSLLFGDRS